VVPNEEGVAIEEVVPESTAELTAEEIAAAVAPLDQPKPVLKQAPEPQPEHAEHHEGIELNDAVQLGSKRNPVKPAGQTPATTNELPIQPQEVTATAEETTPVDPNAVVVVSELHSTTVAAANKYQHKGNKTDQAKTVPADTANQQTETDTESKNGEYTAGAFAVTLSPETTGDAPAPKRRLETTRQTMPEVHESDVKLAAPMVLNTAAAPSQEPTVATAASTTEMPQIPAVSTPTPETLTPPNHLRGPQIPHSFANHLEAAAAERKSADPLNTVDRTRFVQRVARAFQRAGETDGEIRLRLSPPELGAVKLEVSLRDGAMIARMETETTTARNLLMENLPQLKERLAEQNVRIETFEVEVRDQSNHSSADDARDQLREQTELQRNRLRGERATTPVVAQPIVRTLPAARQSSQLNVVI
jgi:flagellar hook-length control protein FliK